MTHDVHHVPWGKVADMAISGEQLVLTHQAQRALYECDGLLSIPCRLVQTNVSLWCVDINVRELTAVM